MATSRWALAHRHGSSRRSLPPVVHHHTTRMHNHLHPLYSMGTGQSRVEPHGSGNLHSEPKLVCSLCYLHNLQRLYSNNLVSCQSALQGTTAGIMLKGTFCQNEQRVSYRIHTQFDILLGRPSAQCRPGKKL